MPPRDPHLKSYMTIVQLKGYAQSQGIELPKQITRKHDIYNYLNQAGQARDTQTPSHGSQPAPAPAQPVSHLSRSQTKARQTGKGIKMRGKGMYNTQDRWYGIQPREDFKQLGSKLIHHTRLCHEHIVIKP